LRWVVLKLVFLTGITDIPTWETEMCKHNAVDLAKNVHTSS